MVRRVNVPSSSRLLLAVLCPALFAFPAVAQSADAAQTRSGAPSTFVVAPSIALPSAPTSVAAGDLNGDGYLDMVVTRNGSASVSVLLGDGKGGFAAAKEYPAGTRPGHVLLADLTGHGRLDVVVTDGATGAVEVLPSHGDGTFGKAIVSQGIGLPVALVAGNFSSSGKIDLAVASAKLIAVLVNDGTGHFTAGSHVGLESPLHALAAADLRGESHQDLVAANEDGTVTVLLGNGEGRFTALPAVPVAQGGLSAVVTGDFNHDGRADIAVTQGESNVLTVLLGKGDGSFEPGVDYAVGNRPASAIVADINGDGHLDIVTANHAANTFSVLLGKGDGILRAALDYTTGNAPVALAAGSFKNDGHTDLAILNSGDRTISVPLGKGDGTFGAAPAYRTGLEQKSIAVGDLNGDGIPDLVVSNYCGEDASCKENGTATVFLARRDRTYGTGSTYSLGSGPVSVALADLTGKKSLDLVAVHRDERTLTVMPGNGKGRFGEAQTYTLAASPRTLLVADFNGDGRPDVAILSDCGRAACTEPGSLDIWLGQSDGALKLSKSYTVGYSPVSIAAADLRGTGHLDLVVANACGSDSSCKSHGTATLFSGNGKGEFKEAGEIDLGSSPSAIAIGNLTGKGFDLVVAERGSNSVDILHADGKGSFGAPVSYKVGTAPAAIAIADFSGSGHPQIAVANFKDSTVSLLEVNTKGTLQSAGKFAVGAGPESLAVVPTGKSGSALVTANGNAGATPMGEDITLLAHPFAFGTHTATVTLNNAPSTSFVNEGVELQITVTGTHGTPTGNMTFFIVNGANRTAISDCNNQNTGNGPALDNTGATVCTTQQLPETATTLTLIATYSGDSNYQQNEDSNTVTQTVSGATTDVSFTGLPTSADIGSPVTFNVLVKPSITPSDPTDGVPIKGSVVVTDTTTSTTLCTVTSGNLKFNASNTTATGSCTAAANLMQLGINNLLVAFTSSDGNYANGNNGNSTIKGTATPTSVLKSGTNPSTVNGAVQFTDTLTGVPASTQPSGSVTFMDTTTATTLTCTGGGDNTLTQNTNNSVATCTVSNLDAANSPHSITAVYAGDTNYSGVTSNTVKQNVNPANTTTTLSPAGAATNVDVAVTFTATITPATPAVALSGNVTFISDGKNIPGCTNPAPLTGNQASCTTTLLTAGTHTITAKYGNDNNYNNSTTAASISQVINQSPVTVAVGALAAITVDQGATYTVTITPVPAPGSAGAEVPFSTNATVQFFDGGNGVGGCAAVKVSQSGINATASCTPSIPSLTVGTHNITATYSGDNNYSGGTTATNQPLVVNQAPTTLTVTPTPSNGNTTVDAGVSYTATISPNVNPAPNPASDIVPFSNAATVIFLDGGTPIGGCNGLQVSYVPSKGDATVTCTPQLSTVTAGTHNITATYSGDTNYAATTTGSTLQENVAKSPTTTALSTAPASPTAGQSVTYNATVTPNPTPSLGTVIVPFNTTTGTVAFKDGNTTIAGCGAIPISYVAGALSATASCPSTAPSAGSHTFVATFSGDSNYNTSASSGGSQSVGQATPTLTISTTGSPSTVNGTVTFTFTVTPPTGNTLQPSGKVTFTDNGNSILGCTTAPSLVFAAGASTAACTTTGLAGGTHLILASWPGDTNFTGGQSSLTQKVNAATVTLAIAAGNNQNPSTIDAAVTFTATVTGFTANVPLTGNIAFTDNGKPLGGCNPVFNTKTGIATCTTATLSGGTHTVGVNYTGDASYTATPATTTQTVNPAATSLKLGSSAATSTVNAQVIFTATLTAPSGSFAPSKTIAFSDTAPGATGPSPIAGCTAVNLTLGPAVGSNSTFTATCTDSALVLGTHTITANYANDSNFSPSTATFTQTVNAARTTTSVLTSLGTSTVDQPVTFTATVASTPGAIKFAGRMSFTDNGTAIPNCIINVDPTTGVAACAYSALTAGSHTIEATYGNDNNFATSNGSVAQTVNAAQSTVSVSSSLNPSVVPNPGGIDDTVTFTALVQPFNSSVKLSGVVTFLDNGLPIADCATPVAVDPATGKATCTTKALFAGVNNMLATYSGDNNYLTNHGTFPQQVQDYSLLVAYVSPVVLTQNSSSSKDPFTPQPITVTPATNSGFAGNLALTCTVTVDQAPTGATVPGCTITPKTLKVEPGGVQPTAAVDISGVGSSPGRFNVTVVGKDTLTGLTHSAQTFPVTVRYASAALSITSGATSGNTGNVQFLLPGGVSLKNITCPFVSGPTLGSEIDPAAISMSCTINPTSLAASANLQTPSVAVTVLTGGGSSTAQIAGSTTLYAGLIGLPVFAIFGLLRGRKTRGAAIFRLFALAALAIAGLQLMGCGGSFTKPKVNGTPTPPGGYDLLIQGTGSDGNTYQSVLTVNVTL